MAGKTVGGDFATNVSAWVSKTKERMEAVFKQSAQDVIEVMQKPRGEGGNMPVDTGFLRASLRASIGKGASFPVIHATGKITGYDPGSVALTIANAKLGDTIVAVYVAAYAKRLNYGFVGKDSLGRQYNQKGYLFVEKAAQQWPVIVRKNSVRLKARVGK